MLAGGSEETPSLEASDGVATDDALLVGAGLMGAAERSAFEQPAGRSAHTTTASANFSPVIGLPFVERCAQPSTGSAHQWKRVMSDEECVTEG